MDFSEIKAAAFVVIDENDPYKASKQLQVKNWCYTFIDLFNIDGPNRLAFFLDALSDNECWEKVDTIHRIKLNRRMTARKMIQEHSSTGRRNPLENFFRYQIACWCCLEADITTMFQEMKPKHESGIDDTLAVKKFVKSLFRDQWSDTLTTYWSHLVGGCESEFQSSSKNLYEYGLELVLDKYTCYVEAVEYFWNKIKSLPEEELSEKKKNEIFMKTLVCAAGTHCVRYPEIFEFCISQVNSDMYSEFLKIEYRENRDYGSLFVLQENLCFHQFKKLFDCLEPDYVSEKKYHNWLIRLEIEEYSRHYATEAVDLFMHMWRKNGYDRHRNRVLRKEMTSFKHRGTLLVPFVKKSYMEPVWAILDKARTDHIKAFMNSEKGFYICSVLDRKGDQVSLNRLLAYKSVECEIMDLSGAGLDSDERHNAKRRKIK